MTTDPTPSADPSPPGWRRWAGLTLLTALAYWLAAQAALLLAIPPSFASPLYPSAGLALAAVMVYGRHALPGVLLGSFLVNLSLGERREPMVLATWALPLLSAVGAALQAALGAALLRWRRSGPLTLGEPREMAIFCLLGAVLSCTLNATLSTWALVAAGQVPVAARAFTWWTWWGGDTLGVLIGTPVALTLIGQPRAAWAPRRVTVALPLGVATLVLGLGTVLVTRWDTERSRNVFEGDAQATGVALEAHMRQSLFALEALHGLFIGSEVVDAGEMQRVSAPWLALPIQLQALGYSQRLAPASISSFEAAVQQQDHAARQAVGQPDPPRPYRVFNRGTDSRLASHASRVGGTTTDAGNAAAISDLVVVRFIEPLAGNAAALGVNSMSVPAARQAISQAIDSNAPAATAAFVLAQEASGQAGVVIYRALYHNNEAGNSVAERRARFEGVVFVTLRMQQSAQAAMADAPHYLDWCLMESQPQATPLRLAGPPGCTAHAAARLHHMRHIAIGGQQWLLHLSAAQADVPDAGYANAWLFSSVGLLSAALLAALLLTVTGRTWRIEAAVAQRTADLRHEIVERQRTEAALRESEQRFRNIFDQAPIGIAFADLDGRLREANPRLREMLGYRTQALALQSIHELVYAADRAQLQHDLGRLRRGELAELQRGSRLQHRSGQTLRVNTSWSLLRGQDTDGQHGDDRLVVVIEDITERQKREDAEQGRQRAESANQAKTEFLSRMSHELRTPLNAMLGFAQLLEHDQRPAPSAHQKAWIAQILQAGWHLLEMINDTLDLSRIDTGMLRLTPAPVALAPLLAHCVAMVGPAAMQRQVSVSQQTGSGPLVVLGDETRIKQVLSNLLSNAVKYNRPGGQVNLSTAPVRINQVAGLQVRVQDTGPGLSAAQQAELFQPFNRLGRELSDTEGTGIGLVISRRLAELMGGGLHVESRPGEGATFVLTLLLAPDQPASTAPS